MIEIGDIVHVKSDREIRKLKDYNDCIGGKYFHPSMYRYCGYEFIVDSINEKEIILHSRDSELRCVHNHAFSLEMLDTGEEEHPEPKIEYNNVKHPTHYTKGGIECKDAIASAVTGLNGFESYCTGNIIKYMWRWKHKNGVEDLNKAKQYIDFLVEKLGKED